MQSSQCYPHSTAHDISTPSPPPDAASRAQEMSIVQDEMDKELAEFKTQFSKPSEYDDAPADDAPAE